MYLHFIQKEKNYQKEEGENSSLSNTSLNRWSFNMLPNNKLSNKNSMTY